MSTPRTRSAAATPRTATTSIGAAGAEEQRRQILTLDSGSSGRSWHRRRRRMVESEFEAGASPASRGDPQREASVSASPERSFHAVDEMLAGVVCATAPLRPAPAACVVTRERGVDRRVAVITVRIGHEPAFFGFLGRTRDGGRWNVFASRPHGPVVELVRICSRRRRALRLRQLRGDVMNFGLRRRAALDEASLPRPCPHGRRGERAR